MRVLKFGGTSVGTIRSLTNVKQIVESIEEPCVVVVSALGGLTDRLIAAAEMARQGNTDYHAEVETARRRHNEIIEALVPLSRKHDISQRIDKLLVELTRIYDGIALLGELTEKTLASVVSFGERMSSPLVSEIINNATYFHSPDFIKTERWFNKNIADTELTNSLIQETMGKVDFKCAVTGGFISTDRDNNEITNLGRGGSDYTAALIAAALNAQVLEIWTDVDGFMTADPRLIPEAFVVNHMTFIESMELCTMGAKVIYPPTIYPVFHKNIPIRILNTFHPEAEGTWITDEIRSDDLPIKGISAIRNTTLISVDSATKISDNIASRTINSMTKNGVNVYLVNSNESKNGFSFSVSAQESGTAIKILTEEFGPELSRGEVENISATYKLATIAVVGEHLKEQEDIPNNVLSALKENDIHVHATSDGTSNTTMAVVVATQNADHAIECLHTLFFANNTAKLVN